MSLESKRKQCIHNKREYLCKECGGKGICEHGRQKKGCKDCGGSSICHRPIVFLRFNPDSNDTHSSFWTIHKSTGILYVSKKNKEEWDKRLHMLNQQIKYWKEHVPEKMVEIIELFY